MIKTYSELITFETYEDRYNYLKDGLFGAVGEATFGSDRYLNQKFYHSREWLAFKRSIIIRDNGCEMGLIDYPISGPITIHHINPLTPEMIRGNYYLLMDPENTISMSFPLHNLLHHSNEEIEDPNFVLERYENDTTPWR